MKEKFQRIVHLTRWKGNQRRIGLTGGIASGKTSVGEYLSQEKKIPILDADLYAHATLENNKDISKAILNRYGELIRNSDQTINRKKLGTIVFSNLSELRWLEKQIHPSVKSYFQKDLMKFQNEPIVILMIPLLFETDMTNICSEYWVVSCNPEQQLERLIKQ